MVEGFKKILRMKQADLKLTCAKYLLTKGYNIEYKDGYIYGEGDIPVLLVAHMDTVHRQQPYQIYYDSEQDILWSPQGIGGDDRCGVYSILKILEEYKPHVLFVEDEEIGCIGSGKAATEMELPEINFIIELDRRGVNDCVFYECGNKDFQEYIESFGFNKEEGSFTDIVQLSDAWDVASVNLSIGYFNEHTNQEIISIKLMEETIRKTKEILEDVNRHQDVFYDYQKTVRTTYSLYSKDFDSEKDYSAWWEEIEEERIKEEKNELQKEKKKSRD